MGNLIGWAGSGGFGIARHGPAMKGVRLARRAQSEYIISVALSGESSQFVPINF